MKKCAVLLLALLLCIAMVACASNDIDDDPAPDGSEYTMDSVAGWWTKPDGYQGLTLIDTFCVDAERELVVSYDDYGHVSDEYPCRYDESGFTIECGDVFGDVTFYFENETLLDEEGGIQYVRCEPLSSDSAPASIAELTGVWYKNGETDEFSEQLLLEDRSYRTQQFNLESGNGSWSLLESNYNDSSYTGPTLDFEHETGFPPATLWVLEDGAVLYDDFHGDYYIQDGVDMETWQFLCAKYELIRDSWECEEDGSSLRFAFFGEVLLEEDAVAQSIGWWSMTDTTLHLEYVDGNAQECDTMDEIMIDYCGKAFTRREAW